MGKKIPMWQIAFIMLVAIVLLIYSIVYTEYGQLHIPLIAAAIIAAAVSVANGWRWSFLEQGVIQSISRSMQSCLILLTVGILIGVWKAGGVIPGMIYYGLKIISPSIFLVTACLLCGIVALAVGSSWSVAGTVGVAMIGIAAGLNISPAVAAGAVVSGSYFGDKMSPLSDTTNLAPAAAGSSLFEHIKHMIWTVTPSMLIALILYGILGMGKGGDVDLGMADVLLDEIAAEFTISPIVLLAPISLIVIVALGIPALPGLFCGVAVGLVFMITLQDIPVNQWFYTMHFGYESVSTAALNANYDVADLLGGGGMDSMLQTVNLILCAMTFGGIMDCTGMLASLAEALLKVARSTGMLITITVFSCFFVNLIASDQYLSIILPGRMYKEAFEDKRLKAKNLSRCLEDSGTITSALIPWNTCGASMTRFLDVPTLQYAPYAFLNWVNPLISIFYGFTGISMEKMSEEEYRQILDQRNMDAEMAAKMME